MEELLGRIIEKIEKKDNEIIFHFSDGAIYRQHHDQDCCECVMIEDINGDLEDLVGYPLLQAEEAVSDAKNTGSDEDQYVDSATWTFYKFATIKGYVTIRWYGSSNGYYSETAYMDKIQDEFTLPELRKRKSELRKRKLNALSKV